MRYCNALPSRTARHRRFLHGKPATPRSTASLEEQVEREIREAIEERRREGKRRREWARQGRGEMTADARGAREGEEEGCRSAVLEARDGDEVEGGMGEGRDGGARGAETGAGHGMEGGGSRAGRCPRPAPSAPWKDAEMRDGEKGSEAEVVTAERGRELAGRGGGGMGASAVEAEEEEDEWDIAVALLRDAGDPMTAAKLARNDWYRLKRAYGILKVIAALLS